MYYSVPAENGFFTINPNGQIRTIRSLDYESAKYHYLLVTASDGGISSRSTVINITIAVEDQEDMVPVFPNKLYEANVPENEVGYKVAKVEVSVVIAYTLSDMLWLNSGDVQQMVIARYGGRVQPTP